MTLTVISTALLLASLSSLIAIQLITPVAARIGLVDIPSARKKHVGEVPLIGGIAVFIGVLTSATLLYPQSSTLNLYLISSALIVFIGAMDDYKDLPVNVRIVAQIIVSSMVVYGAGVHLHTFGDILGLGALELGWFGYPLTIMAILACINAFNMTDGIDGLAGVLSLNAFVSLALLMLLGGSNYTLLPLLIACATVPFLAFNLGVVGGSARKIFMGDAGSMFFGLSVVWILLLGSQGEQTAFRPVTALWLIAVPFWDMCAITIRRLLDGRSPFEADRQHLHHILLNAGYSPTNSLLLILGLSIVCSIFSVSGEFFQISETLMFVSFVSCFLLYYLLLLIQIKKIDVKNLEPAKSEI